MLTKSSSFCERFFATLVISMCMCLLFDASEARLFQYPRYTYRKKGGNQRRYKVKETHCESGCSVLGGLEKTVCERQCISDKCYKELYAWDEVTHGCPSGEDLCSLTHRGKTFSVVPCSVPEHWVK